VHEIDGHGSWLKVPLGKLDTERMVPLDDDTVTLIDRIAVTRTPGRRSRTPHWPARRVRVHPLRAPLVPDRAAS
jgi:hypothetical protein